MKVTDFYTRLRSPLTWGIVATLSVASFAVWLGFQIRCDGQGNCSTVFHTFLQLSPNEIGDTLAGFGSLLALVWLIVAVTIQSSELREQRHEWEEMAKAMSTQTKLFEQERQEREAKAQDETADELLRLLVSRVTEGDVRNGWAWTNASGQEDFIGIFRAFPGATEIDKQKAVISYIIDVSKRVVTQKVEYSRCPRRKSYEIIAAILKALMNTKRKCSKATSLKLMDLRVERAEKSIEAALRKDELWDFNP